MTADHEVDLLGFWVPRSKPNRWLSLLRSVAAQCAAVTPAWATVRGAEGRCGDASEGIANVIRAMKVPIASTLVEANWDSGNHYAALFDHEVVVDLTIRQFDETLPFPYVCTLLDWWATMATIRDDQFFMGPLHLRFEEPLDLGFATPTITTEVAP